MDSRRGNEARRCCWSRWREERRREESEGDVQGGVAVLLNFNEYQGEFLLVFFPCSLSVLPLPGTHTDTHTAVNLCHTSSFTAV